jgi:hypothetical protein
MQIYNIPFRSQMEIGPPPMGAWGSAIDVLYVDGGRSQIFGSTS